VVQWPTATPFAHAASSCTVRRHVRTAVAHFDGRIENPGQRAERRGAFDADAGVQAVEAEIAEGIATVFIPPGDLRGFFRIRTRNRPHRGAELESRGPARVELKTVHTGERRPIVCDRE
jgi:hypothetical protein